MNVRLFLLYDIERASVDPELLQSFVDEALEQLETAEPLVIELKESCEATGTVDGEAINMIFRLFHSMKGSAGFLKLSNVQSVTHEAETLLDLFRKGKATVSTNHADVLFKAIDWVHGCLEIIAGTQSDADANPDAIVQLLKEAIAAEVGTPIRTAAKPVQKPTTPKPEPTPDSEPAAAPELDLPPIEITRSMRDRFVQEATEWFEEIEQCLVQFENNPERVDDLQEAFRIMHSFKGNCGFMGLVDMERLSHRMESLLNLMRKGEVESSGNNVQLVLNLVDVLRDTVTEFSDKGDGAVPSIDVYLTLIGDVLPHLDDEQGDGECDSQQPGILVVDDDDDILKMLQSALESEGYCCTTAKDGPEALRLLGEPMVKRKCKLIITDIMMPGMDGEQLIEAIRKARSDLPIIVITAHGDRELLKRLLGMGIQEYLDKPFEVSEILQQIKRVLSNKEGQAKSAKETEAAAVEKASKAASVEVRSGPQTRAVNRRDIRVDLTKLDQLINLVGELVISEAMVTRHPILADHEDEMLERAIHQLRRVSSELQDVAMSVRMIPLAATFRRMIRLVHDVSGKLDKKIRLQLEGEDTEVDKTVIEMIADPLVHIVRNSCDHGIETPEDRATAGKPEEGTITIEGRHEGGEVWILIRDDGKGLKRDVILDRARERGLVDGDGRDMTDEEVFKLIFEPGFSTAAKVTDVSGRGVGMDVVKKNIEKLKGRVDIRSREGQGTTVILRIPLTLAIIEGMLVRVGKARYTIPLLTIRENVRIEKSQRTVTPDGQEVVRLREELLPVVRLHEAFRIQPDSRNLEDGILIVAELDGKAVCLLVDEILGQQETVIKGISNYLGTARGISGCTILGDGEVSLILDMTTLIAMSADSDLQEERQEQPSEAATNGL